MEYKIIYLKVYISFWCWGCSVGIKNLKRFFGLWLKRKENKTPKCDFKGYKLINSPPITLGSLQAKGSIFNPLLHKWLTGIPVPLLQTIPAFPCIRPGVRCLRTRAPCFYQTLVSTLSYSVMGATFHYGISCVWVYPGSGASFDQIPSKFNAAKHWSSGLWCV